MGYDIPKDHHESTPSERRKAVLDKVFSLTEEQLVSLTPNGIRAIAEAFDYQA